MNNNYVNNLLKDFKEKFKKYKYIVISGTGVAALSITVIILSNTSPVINEKVATNANQESTTNSLYHEDSNSSTSIYSADTIEDNTTALKENTILSRGTPAPLDPMKGDIINLGVKNSIVLLIQNKLMELDYLESDEPSEEFGETMQNAVKLFQRKNELEITGEVDAKTYEILISDKAKAYTVHIGAEGTDVEQLQMRLYELGYISKVTSYFGTDTDAAVKEFQKRNGLYEDGNVGKQTREVLYSSEAIPLSFYIGDENDEILKYQQRLIQLGYLTTKPDGKYGKDTVQAVKHFQEKNGIIADGYIGPATKEMLMSNEAAENAIIMGDSGEDVTNIQKYLKKLGYISSVTGYFGTDTHEAVINFQKKNGLSADGKVGTQTINKLISSDAKKWSGGSSSNSGGSSSSGSSSGGTSSGGSTSGGSTSGGSDSPSTSSPNIESFIAAAKSKLGASYVYGAKGPNSFDCSGLVYWALNKVGVRQSYMTSYAWQRTSKYQKITSMGSIRRGDIISFNGHVGIALGNNQMIDASSNQGKVRITNITSSYWVRNFKGAYRIF